MNVCNNRARIPACGMISQYNVPDKEGVRNLFAVGPAWLTNPATDIRQTGCMVFNYAWPLSVALCALGGLGNPGQSSFRLVANCSHSQDKRVSSKIDITWQHSLWVVPSLHPCRHLPEIMLLSMDASTPECCAGHWQAYLDSRLYCERLHVYHGTTVQQGNVSGVVFCVQCCICIVSTSFHIHMSTFHICTCPHMMWVLRPASLCP